MMTHLHTLALDMRPMFMRKQRFYAYARRSAARVFRPDGSNQPETEPDPRIAFWLYPALVSSPNNGEKDFANLIYATAAGWDQFDVFCTSAIAVNLVRERHRMTLELVKRSEEHLAKFVVRDGGRSGCSGANDYLFQGYNDNMPALSVRAMILAGDILNRRDYTDQGLFYLEGLCAHFERRGLLSEFTSGTYTPITLSCLMDVAEYTTNLDARAMAVACANRILLDIAGHWHAKIGGIGGVTWRAYTADLLDSLSNINTLMWYLTGDAMCIDPIEALENVATFPAYLHHGRNYAFNLAQCAEFFAPSYGVVTSGQSGRSKMNPAGAVAATVYPGVRNYMRTARRYPYEFYATTDLGQAGLYGGTKEIQTRAFHQPLYALATASETGSDHATHQTSLRAVLACGPKPRSWLDRICVWHNTICGDPDQGDVELTHGGQWTEVGFVRDVGHYHSLQKGGSALVLGSLAPRLFDQEVPRLKFSLIFGTWLHSPDELANQNQWYFLRFGDVYVGVQMAGMMREKRLPVQTNVKNKYLRIEIPLVEDQSVKVDQELREWTDFGYVFEIASRAECGTFAGFCRQCLACSWEFYHHAYRNVRYQGRHGELQIIDSVAAGTVRFMAVDGQVEPRVKLSATGLKPGLTSLFPDGHRVRQRRITYFPAYIGSPFYAINKMKPLLQHIVVTPHYGTASPAGRYRRPDCGESKGGAGQRRGRQ